ncbi:MAG: hypothetical protein DRQ88_03880 [Epsilonproteobacteria bacterium]|nr:MAG: hypothetical protein DRQ89_04185 [Campylobacterota bacterium]RLA67177.1 MAG: hypothetical protein DRQ88_03880 [Campylobacterota bacterium]
MKIEVLFLLIFVYGCNGKSLDRPAFSSAQNGEMTALEHLKRARTILRNEEGRLMVMGRSHTEQEKEKYEVFLGEGQVLAEMIARLERLGIK